MVWRALVNEDGRRGNEEKSPIHVADVVRIMGNERQLIEDLLSEKRSENSKCVKASNGRGTSDERQLIKDRLNEERSSKSKWREDTRESQAGKHNM